MSLPTSHSLTYALRPRNGVLRGIGKGLPRWTTSAAAAASTSASASSSTSPSSPSAPSKRRRERHTSGVDLVAPPDPISNIRPIIYASKPSTRPSTNSPYSASEFPSGSSTSTSNFTSEAKLQNLELEWRLRRERVDLMNHRFWATTNTSFNAQLNHRLSILPTPSTPPTAEDEKRKEDALTQFYADWQMANRARQTRWVKEWWRELWTGLKIQMRLYVLRGLHRRRSQ